MTPAHHHINLRGLRVHYTVQGSGPALVLMHGWGCNSSTVASIADVAAESHTVYSLDLPGFGLKGVVEVLSEEPKDVWGTFEYAQLLGDFIQALGLDKPALIGHSYGGRVAIAYAAEHPVSKLVLVDSAGLKKKLSLWKWLKIRAFKCAKWLAPKLCGKERGARFIEWWRGRGGSADYKSSTPMMRQIMARSVNEDLRDLMPKVKAPTLLVWGTNDDATPLSDAKLMERLIPDAGLVEVQGAGHYSFLDNPTLFAAVLRSFLKA